MVILESRDIFVFNADFISFHIIAMTSLGDQGNWESRTNISIYLEGFNIVSSFCEILNYKYNFGVIKVLYNSTLSYLTSITI